jgi:hypothetical protein
MTLIATDRAGSGSACWRTIHCRRLEHLEHQAASPDSHAPRAALAPI